MLNQSEYLCSIEIRPRIHVSLIGLDTGGFRTNGGFGFSITKPTAKIKLRKSNQTKVSDERSGAFTEFELTRIKDRLTSIHPPRGMGVEIVISGEMPSHRGLGSSTAIRLACVEAYHYYWGKSASAQTLIQQSGRGGTSGIGVQTYFKGGFIFDVGVKGHLEHQPSSRNEASTDIPLVLLHGKLPNWRVGLCLPKDELGLSGEAEADFFSRVCPISKDSVREILYIITYGLAAAALESDYATWCAAIRQIQNTEWKKAERNLYGTKLIDLEQLIYSCGADCVGLSSVGPCLFYFSKNITAAAEKLRDARSDCVWIEGALNNEPRRLNV